jgi:hypothetical protein
VNELETAPWAGESANSGNSEFKIIRNAKLPGKKPTSQYPFDELQINDAFEVMTDKPDSKRSAIHYAVKRVAPDIKITIRVIEGGLHVQRIA